MSLFGSPQDGNESVEVDDPNALFKKFEEAHADSCNESILIDTSQVRKALRESASMSQKPKEKITEKEFLSRIEVLLHRSHNPHLKFGLGILAGITESNPGKLRELDHLDGSQTIISVLCNYVTEHLEELLSQIQSNDSLLRTDLSHFVSTEKHQHADPELLTIMYITQLAHIAFHIAYYNYQPVETVDITPWTGYKSAMIMTQFGSVIMVSQAGEEANLLTAEYHRLSIRDENNGDRPLTIASGRVPFLRTQTQLSIDFGKNHLLKTHPHNRKGYHSFSVNRIIAVGDKEITRDQSTRLTESQTSVSQIIKSDMIEAARANHDAK